MQSVQNKHMRLHLIDRIRAGHLLIALGALALTGCVSREEQKAAAPVVVKLIAFNDFHGHINPPTSRLRVADPQGGEAPLQLPAGGVQCLSTLVGQLKAQNERNAVVAAGDLIGGAPLISSLFHHEPTIELLNRLGLEYSSVGNHEFDRGRAELLRMQNGGCLTNDERGSCRNGRFAGAQFKYCLLYTSPSPRDGLLSRMPSSA